MAKRGVEVKVSGGDESDDHNAETSQYCNECFQMWRTNNSILWISLWVAEIKITD